MERILFNDGWKIKKLGDSHEFNLSWNGVTLPHDAVIGEKRNPEQFNGTKKAFFPNGAWEYIKLFEAPEIWKDKCVYLEFQGVQNHAAIYVNGNFAGKCAYGYSEFTVDISNLIAIGAKNVIKVVCKTNDDSRWYTGGGIYRDVNLFVAEKLHIKNNGIKITTLSADVNSATLRVDTELSLNTECKLKTKITYRGETVCEDERQINGSASIKFDIDNPHLWSAEHPSLYECRATVYAEDKIIDTAKETFGVRTLSVSAYRGFTVNGKQVKLRGACIHHDNGVIGVRTFKDAEYRRIKILKEAGFNAIRSAHHPASRYLLQACDELGMYVMDETFDVWQISKSCDDYANDFGENWKSDVAAMVDKDYNHPSVIIYSIGNEISDLASKAGVALAQTLSAEVKKYDNTRFTTVAINGLLLLMQKMELAKQLSGETEEKRDINDAMSSLDEAMASINNAPSMDKIIEGGCNAVDIAGYNYMHHRYLPDLQKYPQRVIVGSETYTKYIADMWEHIENHNNVIGDFTWTGWDYIGETGIGGVSYEKRDYHDGFYGVYPYITAACGDIDITGYRLPQSYYREIVYGLRKQPYIAVHNPARAGQEEYLSTWGWGDVVSSWSFKGFENVPLTVDVYAKGEVELFLNGKSVGKETCDKQCKCTFTVPYAGGELKAVSNGESYVLRSAEDNEVLSVKCENSHLCTGQLAFVNIEITDKNGVLHYGKDRAVTLEVTGGELLGFGSGNPQTEESFADNVHTTYHGRAFAVILSKGEKIKIVASAENLMGQTEI